MARRQLTGALLVGGASTRFGSPKALARLEGETLAERGWRVLGELGEERLAIGKQADGLPLPFELLDDGSDVRAPIAGLVAALRAAGNELCVVLPVDCPLVTAELLGSLADACTDEVDSAVPQTGPLPGAYRRRVLPALERGLASGRLSIRDALNELRVETVECEAGLLANVNTPEELRRLR
ncbi:MAG: molybdenum cofactor guanylyltransferase [Gaiellaceae bacterium]